MKGELINVLDKVLNIFIGNAAAKFTQLSHHHHRALHLNLGDRKAILRDLQVQLMEEGNSHNLDEWRYYCEPSHCVTSQAM